VITSTAKETTITSRECPATVGDFFGSKPDEGEIHIWYAFPKVHHLDLDAHTLLSRDELERVARFRFESDRQNFLFCRSMLRILLASYLGTSPAELRFAYSAHGKPSLAKPSGNLEFNVTHSDGMVLFALSLRKRVGVDVEHIRRDLNVEEIAGRFFSASEKHALMRSSDMHDAFFHCWTRKEAFVKARGEGLSCPLESFDVSVTADTQEVALITRPDAREAQSWRLWSLNSFPGYAAAVAVESDGLGAANSEE
jgi:4'-phosphopantetheinyl transferase